jgi:hypothetical protein
MQTECVRVYRFRNPEQQRYSESFALCDACATKQSVPAGWERELLNQHSLLGCNDCPPELRYAYERFHYSPR